MLFGDPAPASLPDHPDAPAPARSAGPLGVLALARLLADTAWQLGLRASAVATGELSTVLSCDNQLTELGMHDDQRYSCYSCRDWADHAHDWPVPARRTLTAHAAALATTYGTSPAAPVGPQVWIAVSQNHFHSGFLSPFALGACLKVHGRGAGVSWRVHHPARPCVAVQPRGGFGVEGDLADARAAATAALARITI